jgi:hypothetical protein
MDERIQQELLKDNFDWINFRMNPPYASHTGGVWERQIRTVRGVLSGILDQHGSQLDDESLRTFMIEAEAIVNSRPLTVISNTSSPFLEPLTPNHLLTSNIPSRVYFKMQMFTPFVAGAEFNTFLINFGIVGNVNSFNHSRKDRNGQSVEEISKSAMLSL